MKPVDEPVAKHVPVRLDKRLDFVEWQFERPQAPNGDGVLDLRRVVVAVPVAGIDLRGEGWTRG